MSEPLGDFEDRVWQPNPGAYGGRRSRAGGRYRVFIPARIAERSFDLDGEAVLAVAAATKALAELGASAQGGVSLKALGGNLLRSESAASSRIEDLQVSPRRLARAAYRGESGHDRTATEILGNVDAMTLAIEIGAAASGFTVNDLRELHRRLLRFSADRRIAGEIREQQNWIGGNDFNPLDAVYVPPPPAQVPGLLEDLVEFINRDDLAPVAQAAVAHAQFENIHPFADGNGRVGRALIHLVLRRREEIGDVIPPLSLILGSEPRTYIGGLAAFSRGDVSDWCLIFARATERAAREARRLAGEIESLQASWLERLGKPRRDSAARQLVGSLPEQPVLDVASARELTGKSHVAVQKALAAFEAAGILALLNEQKWGRVWECPEIFELAEDFERTALA